jgi:nicotinate dehydrogenase subunit B
MEQLLEALTGETFETNLEPHLNRRVRRHLTRRGFVKAGGTLLVGFGLLRSGLAKAAIARADGNAFDASLPQSWIEIRSDNTVLYRTGKSDFGQGTIYTAYKQIIADELDVTFEAITTVVTADTDTTPEGGGTFGLLGEGTPNIRKAAAYTREALLQLASHRLGVPKDQLKVVDGVVSGRGKHVSYGELVKDQNLQLTIPVGGDLTSIFGLRITGNPPLKPASEMKIVGRATRTATSPARRFALAVRLRREEAIVLLQAKSDCYKTGRFSLAHLLQTCSIATWRLSQRTPSHYQRIKGEKLLCHCRWVQNATMLSTAYTSTQDFCQR